MRAGDAGGRRRRPRGRLGYGRSARGSWVCSTAPPRRPDRQRILPRCSAGRSSSSSTPAPRPLRRRPSFAASPATARMSVSPASIFNRIGGERHAAVIAEACALHVPDVAVLGFLPRADDLALPERHLGLIQAREHPALDAFLDRAAALIAAHVDIGRARLPGVRRRRHTSDVAGGIASGTAPHPADRPADRRRRRCRFCLPLCAGDRRLARRRRRGPAVFAAGRRAARRLPPMPSTCPAAIPSCTPAGLPATPRFLDGLRAAAGRGTAIFGECGGYMVLGRGLVDGEGARHAMAGLLPLETSFAERGLHLGYRRVRLAAATPLGERRRRLSRPRVPLRADARRRTGAGAVHRRRCRRAGSRRDRARAWLGLRLVHPPRRPGVGVGKPAPRGG